MGTWQRTAIRVAAAAALFALLIPGLLRQFRQSPHGSTLTWGIGLVLIGLACFASPLWMRPEMEQMFGPKWGYGVPKRWRWVMHLVIVLAGLGFIWWSFKL